MVFLEDFTRISGQSPSFEGYVPCCRRCGRAGMEQQLAYGGPVVIHSQISEVLGDGMRVDPQDCCAVPRIDGEGRDRREGGVRVVQNRAI